MNNHQILKTDPFNISSPERDFSLFEFKQTLQRRWKPALAIATVVFAGISSVTFLQSPKYRSESIILLDNDQKNQVMAPVIPGMSGSQQMFMPFKDLSTEIMILKSRSLISKAMSESKEAFGNLTLLDVQENLSIQQAKNADMLVISYVDRSPERAKEILDALAKIYVDHSLEKQRLQATNAVKFIDERMPETKQELSKSARAIREFRQRYKMNDPDEYALRISELKYNLEQQAKATEIELSRTRKNHQQLRSQLAKLGQNPDTSVVYTVLGQDRVYQDLASQLKDLESQYAIGRASFYDNYPGMEDVKAQREELQKLLRERAQQVLGKTVERININQVSFSQGGTTSVVQSPGTSSTASSSISSSSTSATPTESANTSESSTTPNNTSESSPSANPTTSNEGSKSSPSRTSTSGSSQFKISKGGTKVSAGGSILQTLTGQLIEAENEATILQAQLEAIQKAKAQIETNFANLPKLQQIFAELKRELEVKSQAASFLMGRRQEMEIAAAAEVAPWQVVDPPFLPNVPVSPNIPRNLLMGLMAGGILGIGYALLLQKLDQRLKQVDEVRVLTQLPVLGTIPKVENPLININTDAKDQLQSYQYSSFTEAMRYLAMNLRYLIIETGRIKVLTMTSATSSEGKTTVTYNLGLVLAELGWRVLVVDADMRKPRVHKLAQKANKEGLSSAIASDRPWQDFIHTDIATNLHVMTAGPTSPNPVALLNSHKMKHLVEEWREIYDYVLIDTPPVGVMADAQSLATQGDGVIVVSGIQRTTRTALSHSMEFLRGSQCNLVGFVANMVEKEFDSYSYSYYDYYYNQHSVSEENGNSNENHVEGKLQNILQQFRRR
jgi:succinoglycan biosynthesis transport protein ExoP